MDHGCVHGTLLRMSDIPDSVILEIHRLLQEAQRPLPAAKAATWARGPDRDAILAIIANVSGIAADMTPDPMAGHDAVTGVAILGGVVDLIDGIESRRVRRILKQPRTNVVAVVKMLQPYAVEEASEATAPSAS